MFIITIINNRLVKPGNADRKTNRNNKLVLAKQPCALVQPVMPNVINTDSVREFSFFTTLYICHQFRCLGPFFLFTWWCNTSTVSPAAVMGMTPSPSPPGWYMMTWYHHVCLTSHYGWQRVTKIRRISQERLSCFIYIAGKAWPCPDLHAVPFENSLIRPSDVWWSVIANLSCSWLLYNIRRSLPFSSLGGLQVIDQAVVISRRDFSRKSE